MANKLVRIGVVSDSHGDITSLEAALIVMGEIDYILHAGDNLRDSVRLSRILTIPVIGVAGNCDYLQHPTEEIIELGGQRFFIAHGHNHGVKTDTSGIIQAARRYRVDIAIYGHTHVPALFVQYGILFLNPGSTSAGRKGTASSCAVLTIEDTHVDAAFVPLRKMPYRAH
ncbi:MAG: metallophosphoesterase [Bacillota bacterium]|nr:metallophosphoesterase [Bacillota bacterium]